jgi:hypothetical protein
MGIEIDLHAARNLRAGRCHKDIVIGQVELRFSDETHGQRILPKAKSVFSLALLAFVVALKL